MCSGKWIDYPIFLGMGLREARAELHYNLLN